MAKKRNSNPFVIYPSYGTLKTGMGDDEEVVEDIPEDDSDSEEIAEEETPSGPTKAPGNALESVTAALGPGILESPGKGAVAGAVAGGTVGMAIGPIGALIGAAIGAAAGGGAGLVLGKKAKKAKKKQKQQIQAELNRQAAQEKAVRDSELAAQVAAQKALSTKRAKIQASAEKAAYRISYLKSRVAAGKLNDPDGLFDSLTTEVASIKKWAQSASTQADSLTSLESRILSIISTLDGIAKDSGLTASTGLAGLGEIATKVMTLPVKDIWNTKITDLTSSVPNPSTSGPNSKVLGDWFKKIRATNRVISGLPAAPLPIIKPIMGQTSTLAGLSDSNTTKSMAAKSDATLTILTGLVVGGIAAYCLKTRK